MLSQFNRITFAANIMRGRACIRGMRIPVSLILSLLANPMTMDEIITAYPYLEPEDILQSIRYAAWLAEDSVHELALTA